jgi:hypothetical protein
MGVFDPTRLQAGKLPNVFRNNALWLSENRTALMVKLAFMAAFDVTDTIVLQGGEGCGNVVVSKLDIAALGESGGVDSLLEKGGLAQGAQRELFKTALLCYRAETGWIMGSVSLGLKGALLQFSQLSASETLGFIAEAIQVGDLTQEDGLLLAQLLEDQRSALV